MIWALVAVAAIAAVGIWNVQENDGILQLTMAGDRMITLEYGQPFDEPGATAQYRSIKPDTEPKDVQVTQIGRVDVKKLGIYNIKYIAEYDGHVGTAYRRVRVVDTCPPEITLTVNEGSYTLPGQQYQEEGFAATDNYDGDITDRVQRTEQDGIVTYTVSDTSGNSTVITRTINYNDPVAPELTLQGDAHITIKAGQTYMEPGYTAVDNCDGDITAKVTSSGGPDVYNPGTYVITYTVQDSFGNQTSAQRTVNVLPVSDDKVTEPTGKVIYLTFDDGPGPDTERLLDILAKYNVKVTFFVVNTSYISTIQRAAQEGHTIAIHTATHKFQDIYASDEAYFEDLYQMQSIIESYTGQKPMLLRFPGGSSNSISSAYNKGIMTRLTQKVTELSFQHFDWNVDSDDAGSARTATQVFNNVINGIGSKQNSVVLQHDIKSFSVDAVEQIIIWGLNNGYSFQALDANSPGCHHRVYN